MSKIKLTPAQHKALLSIERAGNRKLTPWSLGTATCTALRRMGLVAVSYDPSCMTRFGGRFGYDPDICLTDAGRELLYHLKEEGQ